MKRRGNGRGRAEKFRAFLIIFQPYFKAFAPDLQMLD